MHPRQNPGYAYGERASNIFSRTAGVGRRGNLFVDLTTHRWTALVVSFFLWCSLTKWVVLLLSFWSRPWSSHGDHGHASNTDIFSRKYWLNSDKPQNSVGRLPLISTFTSVLPVSPISCVVHLIFVFIFYCSMSRKKRAKPRYTVCRHFIF